MGFLQCLVEIQWELLDFLQLQFLKCLYKLCCLESSDNVMFESFSAGGSLLASPGSISNRRIVLQEPDMGAGNQGNECYNSQQLYHRFWEEDKALPWLWPLVGGWSCPWVPSRQTKIKWKLISPCRTKQTLVSHCLLLQASELHLLAQWLLPWTLWKETWH